MCILVATSDVTFVKNNKHKTRSQGHTTGNCQHSTANTHTHTHTHTQIWLQVVMWGEHTSMQRSAFCNTPRQLVLPQKPHAGQLACVRSHVDISCWVTESKTSLTEENHFACALHSTCTYGDKQGWRMTAIHGNCSILPLFICACNNNVLTEANQTHSRTYKLSLCSAS